MRDRARNVSLNLLKFIVLSLYTAAQEGLHKANNFNTQPRLLAICQCQYPATDVVTPAGKMV